MKILELRFKNLNSLYGEWVIDFTHPEYLSNGIFALTGPTGAGKSTILDAICLALYGATPRLGKITKANNDIMSRQTGDCYAEVLFESETGKFRCNFAQHRARKKATGDLQPPQHEISYGTSNGKVIENQIRSVAKVIEQKTGMDFDRFTRSILLAQGGFDTFLKAGIEEKSKILEQITGTEIYTTISKRVHERSRQEKDLLNILNAETTGFNVLDQIQEVEIKQNLEESEQKQTDLSILVDESGKSIEWLNGIKSKRRELDDLFNQTEKLKSTMEDFVPQRKILEFALKAANFDGIYATLIVKRNQLEVEKGSLKDEETKLLSRKFSVTKNEEILKGAELIREKAGNEIREITPVLVKVRSIDQSLNEMKRTVNDLEKDVIKQKQEIKKISSEEKKILKERETAKDEIRQADEYLKNNSRDQWLISGFAGVEERFITILATQKEKSIIADSVSIARKTLKTAQNTLKKRTVQLNLAKEKAKKTELSVNEGNNFLTVLLDGVLLREYRTQKETLLREMSFHKKIEDLKQHREKLIDGEVCPLCGAVEHPFAEGNTPVVDDIEIKINGLSDLIKQADVLELQNKQLADVDKKAVLNLADSDKKNSDAESEKTYAEKSLKNTQDRLDEITQNHNELKISLLERLKPLGIEQIPHTDAAVLLDSLRERLNKFQFQAHIQSEVKKQILEYDNKLERILGISETLNVSLQKTSILFDNRKKDLLNLEEQRKKLFGKKNVNTEENRFKRILAEAEENFNQAGILDEQAKQKLLSVVERIDKLKDLIKTDQENLKVIESDFVINLNSDGFANEEQFNKACLSVKERDKLLHKAKELDEKETRLTVTRKDREIRLQAEISKCITNSSMEELKPIFEKSKFELVQIIDLIAGFKHKILENVKAKDLIRKKQIEIEKQKKECSKWEKLYNLIGSADGKKFRNFAQGLTFELMVSHANIQLGKMTDRYLLLRDDLEPLKLNVIDNYQAGEIRSTRNLSGGESFIVSLSLALGLSSMSSHKVRVDSLFLDEGFGTLDEETLEMALDTLANLKQDGKLIGVISHISSLKDRITTQIYVSPESGGKSLITGPGCRRV